MSRLPDTVLADVCRKAGFVGPELHTAIASAIASSGGIPGYEHRIDPGPLAHYRGLWGLDTVQWPDYAGRELENPHTAARVAHELVGRTGGWSWCPAYRAGIHGDHYATARGVAGRLPNPYEYPEPFLLDTHARRGRQGLERLGALTNLFAHARPTRG